MYDWVTTATCENEFYYIQYIYVYDNYVEGEEIIYNQE
tara:strand:+ start:27242 stop:27355 length:114 start_codon:yes stop_codon:yes gene_type:complete